MTTPMQCDNCSTSRKLRLVSELFSAVSRTQPVRRRTLSQLRTEFLADRPAPWQRRLCSSELSAGTSATTPVSTLDKARSSLLDGLSLGQHSTARAQHSKFSSPEDLSHDPQNTPSKFHRRSPSGVRDLGFWKCWHCMDGRTDIWPVLQVSSTEMTKGVFIATQLNWTQLTQLNSVQPSQSCFCLWRHDPQTESTVVHTVNVWTTRRRVQFSWVELCCYKRPLTSSSAVAKRPRDASCLSVVSFNSTILHVQYLFRL